MVLGNGEAKATPSNPKGFSKRQLNVLGFLKEREIKTMDISAAGGMRIIPSGVLKITTRMDLISICSSRQGRVPQHETQIDVL